MKTSLQVSFFCIIYFLVSSCQTTTEKDKIEASNFFLRGNQKSKEKEYREALKWYNEAIEKDPSLSDAYFNRGLVYVAIDKNPEALADFEKAVELDSNFAAAYRQIGDIQLQNKEFSKALSAYQISLKIEPKNVEAKINEGVVYQEMGELDLAEKSFKSVLATGKYKDLIYNNLGYIEIERKQYETAKKWIEKALYLSPENELYLRNLKRIEDESGLK